MRIVSYLVIAAAACGGASSEEVRAAKDASYSLPPPEMFRVAMQGANVAYKIDPRLVDVNRCAFATARRYYSATGDLESPGAGGYTMIEAGSIGVSFVVQIVPAASGGGLQVNVTPDTLQVVSGSPQPRKLRPDDPYLPPWVLGRADQLAIEIHQRLDSAPGQNAPSGDWRANGLTCTQG
ncbi:MAG TPA: hypothetical protein VGM88_30895 [Kofleriaceae bacterium]|jgi:hypothetical protein